MLSIFLCDVDLFVNSTSKKLFASSKAFSSLLAKILLKTMTLLTIDVSSSSVTQAMLTFFFVFIRFIFMTLTITK